MWPTETSVQLQITAEDYSDVSALTKGQLTMPEAMLLAKLTLCSHGNGSCWPRWGKRKQRERSQSVYIKCQSGQNYIRAIMIIPCWTLPLSGGHSTSPRSTCTCFIYSVLLPVDVPSGPPRSREPTYHSRVDFRSTSSHTVNTSVLSLLSVCFVVALHCAGTAGGGIDG